MTTAAAVVTTIRRASETLFVELPGGLTKAIDAADALIESAEALAAAPQQLHSLALDCLAQGRDPAGDKLVARAALHHQLATSGLHGAARARAENNTAEALLKYSGDLLGGWQQALAPRLAELTAAAAALPADIGDYEAIVGRGTTALEHWQRATTAIRMVGAATSAVSALATLGRISIPRDRLAVVYTLPDIQVYDEIRGTGEQITCWLAARSGLELALVSSLPELVQRLEGYDTQRVQSAADYERARHPRRPSYLPAGT